MPHTIRDSSRTSLVKAFHDCEEGATAIQYAVIAALVAAGCITAFSALGAANIKVFEAWTTAVGKALKGTK